MKDEKGISQLIESLPIKEIYNDLFSPGLKKAGEFISTILDGPNLILFPLKMLNEKSRIYFKRNMELYQKKLNDNNHLTPQEIPQYIGTPIIDKLIYLEQNELADIFINLLTKASFEETANSVHPVYLNILNNLSIDEARILHKFNKTISIPFIDIYVYKFRKKTTKTTGNSSIKSRDEILKGMKIFLQKNNNDYIKYAYNLTGIHGNRKIAIN